MSFFEIAMLVCFGVSWPISIAKSLRTKIVSGKSPVFLGIICLGYLSGIVHKALFARDWVIALYVANLIMVAGDLILYFRYSGKTTRRLCDSGAVGLRYEGRSQERGCGEGCPGQPFDS